jgi:hypothetical protein
MKRLIPAAALCVGLAACGTTGKGASVPFPLPGAQQPACPAVPDYGFDDLDPASTLFVKVQTLLADRELALDYERKLRAVAPTGCR